MPKRVVVNFAKGGGYPQLQARLVKSLKAAGYHDEILTFSDDLQLGCRPHSEVPYGFKVWAIQAALELAESVLWCDASVLATRNPQGIFGHIEEFGYILFDSGWNCAQWTSDKCLLNFSTTRDEAKKMVHYSGGCVGLSRHSTVAQEFLRHLVYHVQDGTSFQGAWSNEAGQVSTDPYCLGHRHDQSVGSLIAARLGMKILPGRGSYFEYNTGPKNVGPKAEFLVDYNRNVPI
jgi:hypothetical protein